MSKTIYTTKETTKENTRWCKYCSASLENHHFNAQFCSKEHRKLLLQDEAVENSIKNSTPDMVECKICGLRAHNLNSHISSIHKIKVKEYKKLYNDAPLQSEKYTKEASERIKGKENPAWQHGGKFSPYSENFIKYTDGSAEYSVEDVFRKIKKTKKANPQNDSTKIEYYLKQGLSHDEAAEALSDRQATFTKEKCIIKYGEEEGLKRWKERQEKWLETLDSKTPEEKIRINRLKVSTGCNISKAEYEIVKKLKEHNIQVEHQYLINHQAGYIYDIKYKNKIIEYNGDYWHCNPNNYSSDYFNKKIKMTAEEKWKKDLTKINFAKENGFEVLVVWENDYKANKKDVFQKCIEFLND